MKPAQGAGPARVAAALAALGFPLTIVEFDASTRSAAEAARACGCAVGQIAKSLVFKGMTSGRPYLAVASGAHRVDEAKLAALVGETLAKADAAFVREHTGYAIGGVPPIGHAAPILAIIDADLLRFESIWAAGGAPNAVFALTPDQLVRMTGGRVGDIAQGV
jgi:prolyl-tRNA editing enzyme YbaK/EbsC (Cys-tRNA(Pro) deacylase)